jgi:hypothetical protein
MWSDEDGIQSITRTKPEDRQNYFMLVNPFWQDKGEDGKLRFGFWSVPKGPTMKILVNPIQEVLDTSTGQSKQTGVQTVLDAFSNVLPGNINLKEGQIGESVLRGAAASANPVIGGAVGMMTGKDPTWNTSILGNTAAMAQKEQFKSTTSPTVKAIARFLDNPVTKPIAQPLKLNSPLSLEFMLDKSGVKTGLMDVPWEFSDWLLSRAGVAKPKTRKSFEESPTEWVRNEPLVGGFARRILKPSADQESRLDADALYQLAEQSKLVANTFMHKTRIDQEDALKYLGEENNRKLYALNGPLQKAVQDLAALRTQMEAERSKGSGPQINRALELLKQRYATVLATVTDRLRAKNHIPGGPEPVRAK